MQKLLTLTGLLIVAPLLMATVAEAQAHTFTTSGLLGFGGSIDENDAGLSNLAWQLGFSNAIDAYTHFGVRVGGIEWDPGDRIGFLTDPSLRYVTLTGEYRESSGSFSGSFVDSGVYLGLGFYQLEASRPSGEKLDETAVGLVFGVSGDMALNQRRSLALRIELSGHYATLDAAQAFGMAQIGLTYRF